MPPAGFEPAHPPPEGGALSPELRGREAKLYRTKQAVFCHRSRLRRRVIPWRPSGGARTEDRRPGEERARVRELSHLPGLRRAVRTRPGTTHCPICEDERQYVPQAGQLWTTKAGVTRAGLPKCAAPGGLRALGIGTEPKFAIGQRALLVPGEGGNLLWDCVTYLDDDTVAAVNDLGGISAIAISHPHYYSTMVEWSEAFGGVPIYIHARDDVGPAPRRSRLWDGDSIEALPGRTLYRAGIHFAGGTIVHWADGAEGRGALCTGDIFQVVEDRGGSASCAATRT